MTLLTSVQRPNVIRSFILNMLLIFPATLFLVVIGLNALKSSSPEQQTGNTSRSLMPSYHPDQEFNDYWYRNAAELNRYELKQARYGEIRKGEAVLIFVTEHLDPTRHIKTDNDSGKDIPVLKCNQVRKFYTGIYPYSIMTSVFTPVNLHENPSTLRTTFSSQEWCGHVWAMLDLKGVQYKGEVHSYFAGEADYGVTLPGVLLEDDVFNRIRIDPAGLPVGDVTIVPPMMHLRLQHKEFRIYHAEAAKGEVRTPAGDHQSTYELNYTDLDRKVVIYYDGSFPHQIRGWEETYKDGFGDKARTLTTSARLTNTVMLDYWTRNSEADSIHRQQLGLTE